MADATKTTARHIGHMTYTQAPAVYEKNIFHLFRFTQPVKNYSFNWNMDNFKFNFLSRGQLESLNLDRIFLPLFKILPC